MIRNLTILIACLVAIAVAPAATAEPSTKPLRVVIQISESQPAIWNLALNNVRNVQKEVGAKNVVVEVVAYGPGLALLRDDSTAANRVQEAMASGVRFVACRNTMENQKVTEAEMVPGISYAQAGVIEIIQKQAEGYAYLKP